MQNLIKMDTHVDMRGETGPLCDKSYDNKSKMWRHVRIVHLKLFTKKCKYADCEWPRCDEEAERLQHYVKKHGEDHPEITCQSCKTTFSQINLRNTLKKYGNKIADYACDKCTKAYRDKYWWTNHMRTDHPEPDQDVTVSICPKCGKSLRSPQSLKTHRKYFCCA